MHFTIADVTINPLLLASIGFLVGIMGGFFGVGGGFIAGPLMFLSGVPMNFVIGTDLAYMTGKSIVAANRHRSMGHVDVKLGLLMVIGAIPGVEVGARIIEYLERVGSIDIVVGITYILIMICVSGYTFWEGRRAVRQVDAGSSGEQDMIPTRSIFSRVQGLKLAPMISLPVSKIESISLWVIIGIGFLTGVLSGLLGVGGGFVRMPVLVYIVGVPTHIAIGTDLFEIMISAGFGMLTHALKGNVDIMIALVMHTGAALGAQFGASLTRYVEGPRIRLMFSILPLIGALIMLYRLVSGAAF
ncbi:MAG: sulfite exporter TauE/SafE family protein [Anaerolineae bacterium]|nr:sulfite exporter TauE/SafE family protein [Anaerolineae bacterium]